MKRRYIVFFVIMALTDIAKCDVIVDSVHGTVLDQDNVQLRPMMVLTPKSIITVKRDSWIKLSDGSGAIRLIDDKVGVYSVPDKNNKPINERLKYAVTRWWKQFGDQDVEIQAVSRGKSYGLNLLPDVDSITQLIPADTSDIVLRIREPSEHNWSVMLYSLMDGAVIAESKNVRGVAYLRNLRLNPGVPLVLTIESGLGQEAINIDIDVITRRKALHSSIFDIANLADKPQWRLYVYSELLKRGI